MENREDKTSLFFYVCRNKSKSNYPKMFDNWD